MSTGLQIVVCGGVVPDPLQTLEPVTGAGVPSLKNEMMLPAVLDPWAGHALFEGGVGRDAAPGCLGNLLAVLEPAGGDQRIGAPIPGGIDVVLAEVPGVGEDLPGCGPVLAVAWSSISVNAGLSAAESAKSVATMT